MAKIPIILEPGRADGKLATSGVIFDENKGMFQSELNDIQDTLNSDNPNKPLSAKQGKILKELLDAKVIEAGNVPIDTEPTEGNTTNVVNSDGIYKALSKKVNNVTFEERNKNQDEKFAELEESSKYYDDIIPQAIKIKSVIDRESTFNIDTCNAYTKYIAFIHRSSVDMFNIEAWNDGVKVNKIRNGITTTFEVVEFSMSSDFNQIRIYCGSGNTAEYRIYIVKYEDFIAVKKDILEVYANLVIHQRKVVETTKYIDLSLDGNILKEFIIKNGDKFIITNNGSARINLSHVDSVQGEEHNKQSIGSGETVEWTITSDGQYIKSNVTTTLSIKLKSSDCNVLSNKIAHLETVSESIKFDGIVGREMLIDVPECKAGVNYMIYAHKDNPSSYNLQAYNNGVLVDKIRNGISVSDFNLVFKMPSNFNQIRIYCNDGNNALYRFEVLEFKSDRNLTELSDIRTVKLYSGEPLLFEVKSGDKFEVENKSSARITLSCYDKVVDTKYNSISIGAGEKVIWNVTGDAMYITSNNNAVLDMSLMSSAVSEAKREISFVKNVLPNSYTFESILGRETLINIQDCKADTEYIIYAYKDVPSSYNLQAYNNGVLVDKIQNGITVSNTHVIFKMKSDFNQIRVYCGDGNNAIYRFQLHELKDDVKYKDISTDILYFNKDEEFIPKLELLRGKNDNLFTFLHFSDVHGSDDNIKRILKFYYHHSTRIDACINTGDIERDSFNDYSGFESIDGYSGIMTIIGNHDTREGSNWVAHSGADAYNKYIAPYINSWNVEHNGNTTYYYKDVKGLRLIFLDAMDYKEEQNVWFENLLSNSQGYKVVVFSHFVGQETTKIPCSFSSKLVDSVGTGMEYYEGCLLNTCAIAIDSFIKSGGQFISWFIGHVHRDWVGYITAFPEQLVVAVDTARVGYGRTSQPAEEGLHLEGYKSMDCFNVVSIDTDNKLIKIVRVGCDYDITLTKKDTVCISYDKIKIV